ncbi:MAG: CcoQ/FixQ family Cbb3-type cytochrome c oxidase assembly chaperone [Verrucomicrobia bacterium]|nr:CcoQ/FixQ family Cbb3-type cytochrome c oxidase assembly chaperone [Verrucomicrobiota bacterium]
MLRNVVEHIGGVGLYGIISISLFFAFFTGMLIWALRLKKSYLNSMRELPLDGGEVAPEPQNEKPLESKRP